MRSLVLAACSLVVAGGIGCTHSPDATTDRPPAGDVLDPGDSGGAMPPEPRPQRFCPQEPQPRVVEIREANPQINKAHHDLMRRSPFGARRKDLVLKGGGLHLFLSLPCDKILQGIAQLLESNS
jgi:hypothetical protein